MTIDTMKFVEQAVSKDKSRRNLMSVYSDNGVLVATDNHRVHMGPPSGDKYTGYPDGNTGRFPYYQEIIPKKKQILGRVHMSPDVISLLGKIVPLIGAVDREYYAITLIRDDALLTATHTSRDLKVRVKLGVITTGVYSFRCRINVKYLYEAIKHLTDRGGVTICIETAVGKTDKFKSPLVITSEDHIAIIMLLAL